MGIGTGGAIALGTGLGAAGSLGGAALQSSAAGSAAKTQAGAAEYAANLQAQLAQEGLNLQAGQYNNSLGLLAPQAQTGEAAGANIASLLGILPQSVASQGLFNPQPLGTPGIPSIAPGSNYLPQGQNYGQQFGGQAPSGTGASPITPGAPGAAGTSGSPPTIGSTVNPALGAPGSLAQGFGETWTPPTIEQAQKYPGYQFQLQQGENAIQNSAAAQGGLLSGNTAEALNNYAQGTAQQDYGNVYSQSLNDYLTHYNVFQQNQANQFNRLASLAGLGQVSAQQLQGAGQNAANSSSSLLNTAGQQIGQNLNNAAAATASGYIGSANAYGGALGNIGSNLSGLIGLNSLLGNQRAQYSPASVGSLPLTDLNNLGQQLGSVPPGTY